MEQTAGERLENFSAYKKSLELWDSFLVDSDSLGKDYRGREIVKQMVRSVGSMSANIEEGYGRGFGKELAQFLRISRGSARESRGWYWRARRFFPVELVEARRALLDEIIAILVATIQRLERRQSLTPAVSSLVT